MAVATGAITLPAAPSATLPRPAAAGRGRPRQWVLRVAAALAVLIALGLVGLRLVGVEWFVVTTPSMGTAVPVGSIAVDQPVRTADLAVGDVITFLPPGAAPVVHTHRIVGIGAEGVSTKGDANAAPDPWTLSASRIRGRVVTVLPGLGWLVRMLPVLLVGGLITWGASMLLRRPDLRAAAVVLGASTTVSVACLIFRPLVNAVLLSATVGGRGAVATVVSTGLLPARVAATTGTHVDLVNGQIGVLRSSGAVGRIDLAVSLQLPPVGWALVVGICVLPLAVPFASALLRRRA